MKDDENLKNNSVYKPKNNREWFLHHLFTDSDFIKEKDSIVASTRVLLGEEACSGVTSLVLRKQSLYEQLKELSRYSPPSILEALQPDKPELHFDPNSPAAKIIKQIEGLAKNSGVSVRTVELGLKYSKWFPQKAFNSIPSVNVEDGQVVVRLNGVMKLSDIKDVYPTIVELQKELPDYLDRNRSGEKPALIYAIYKHRLKGLTFSQIYKLYENANLSGYTGPTSITGEDNLERWYNKYKPAI
jgi:hypothetical protein